jgi:hypothetical protein
VLFCRSVLNWAGRQFFWRKGLNDCAGGLGWWSKTINDTLMETLTLAPAEAEALAHHEAVIDRNRPSFIAAGESLLAIREGRLYRKTHQTFEAYCRERHGFTRMNASLLIRESEAATSVKDILQPNREQARELAKVEPAKRKEVVERAQEATGGKITAAAIREAAVEAVDVMYPVHDVTLSAESKAAGEQAEKDSERLWLLKSTWRKTNKKDRAAFIKWANTQDQ